MKDKDVEFIVIKMFDDEGLAPEDGLLKKILKRDVDKYLELIEDLYYVCEDKDRKELLDKVRKEFDLEGK